MVNDPFALFQMDPHFDICQETLEQKYEKMVHIHPDAWGSGFFKEQTQNMLLKIHEAYEILKNPLKRARWLFESKGVWPIPVFPDIMEEIFQCTLMDEKERQSAYAQAYLRMAQGFDQDRIEEAQKAYWLLKHLG